MVSALCIFDLLNEISRMQEIRDLERYLFISKNLMNSLVRFIAYFHIVKCKPDIGSLDEDGVFCVLLC